MQYTNALLFWLLSFYVFLELQESLLRLFELLSIHYLKSKTSIGFGTKGA